jgi:hypothetical protein
MRERVEACALTCREAVEVSDRSDVQGIEREILDVDAWCPEVE